jgi:hypothetical protein
MSTLTMPASNAPRSKFGGAGRFLSSMRLLFEAVAEARQMERDAKRRYPFAHW